MAKYVEAKQAGYFNGKRQVGDKFWITDENAFSEIWMKPAEETPDDPEPKSQEQSDAAAQEVAEKLKLAETERDAAKAEAEIAKEKATEAEAELAETKEKLKLAETERDAAKAEAEKPEQATQKTASKKS